MSEVFFDSYPQHNGLLLFTIFANYNSQFVRNLEQGSKSDTELKKTLYWEEEFFQNGISQ